MPPPPAPDSAMAQPIGWSSVHDRVMAQQAALFALMKSGVLSLGEGAADRELTEITARTLGVERVSIWRFTDDRSALRLTDLFEATANVHSSGAELRAADYPAYFDSLLAQRAISVGDARIDPRTHEFRDGYLVPNGIVSMLDAGIWRGSERFGVVCAESVNQRREWTPDEQLFVASIADLVMLAHENRERAAAELAMQSAGKRYAQVFQLSPDLMVVTRLEDGLILDVNAAFTEHTGVAADQVLGKSTDTLDLWVDPERREAWRAEMARNGYVRGFEAELRVKHGEIRAFQISSEVTTIDGVRCAISVSRDVTEAKRQAHLVFEIAQGVGAETGDSFFTSLVDHLQKALRADLAFIGELSKTDEGMATASDASTAVVKTIAAHGREGPRANFSYALAGSPCETIVSSGVCAYPDRVASLFPRDHALATNEIVGYVGAPLQSTDGSVLGLIAVLFKQPIVQSEVAVNLMRIFATRAAAELERRNQLVELEYRASHDLLTGLPNRAVLEARIENDIGKGDGRSALLLLDLDRFKEVNDTLGHRIGDAMLRTLAARLTAEIQSGLGESRKPATHLRSVLARTGGDEFALWITGLEQDESLIGIATLLREQILPPISVEGYSLEVGASIGISVFPSHAKSASELLRCAEVAMYRAKRSGGAVAIYERAHDPYTTKRLALLAELGAAVRGNQLRVVYQPRIHLASNRPAGFEALVRWQHPQHGVLPPGQFVPLAELSDVIRPLTLDVLDQALAQLARWHGDGHKVDVSVNLSARNLMDASCGTQIESLIAKHGLSASSLELEITESAIITDPERAAENLARLHQLGVRIAIDDFGTGYSSLSHLRRLPIDALKIDVSFVTNMLASEADAAIVASTIALAHSLGMSVVAEGIEDAATQRRLTELACNEGQGYFVGRPMSAAEASAWMRSAERAA